MDDVTPADDPAPNPEANESEAAGPAPDAPAPDASGSEAAAPAPESPTADAAAPVDPADVPGAEAPAPDASATGGVDTPEFEIATGEVPVPAEPVTAEVVPDPGPAVDPDAVTPVPVVPAAPLTPTYAVTPPAVAAANAPKKSRTWLAVLIGLLIGALIGGAAGGAVAVATRDDEKTVVHDKQTVIVNKSGTSVALGALLKQVEPAVVAIRTSESKDGLSGEGSLPQGGSAGTGFVIESDGIILTNYHVIQGAAAIDATFTNGTRKTATVLGTAPDSDIAVLKVDGKGLTTLPLGDSSKATVGEDVVAIGNALALEGGLTVTTGILSGTNRTIQTEDGTSLQDMLQTDAAINPGNSGGPLVNADGEAIGINTATADPASYGGIGFAIAINTVKPMIKDLEDGKSIKRARLGVSTVSNSPTLAEENDLGVDTGAVIVRVEADGAADAAGIEKGDVVVKFDGDDIQTAEDLTAAVRRHKPGDKVEVEFYRGKDEKTVTVTLGTAPDSLG